MMRKMNSRVLRNNSKHVKALSVAALAGAVAFGAPAFADNAVTAEANETNLLKSPSVEQPTLDYLKENNVEIPEMVANKELNSMTESGSTLQINDSAYTVKH